MMISKSFLRIFPLLVLSFFIDSFSVAIEGYKHSWVEGGHVVNEFVHKSIAKRIANAKARSDLSGDKNIAGFGIAVSAKCVRTGKHDVFYVEYPRLFYSSYSVVEDNPFFETDGSQIIAVSDMFRGRALSGESKKHNLCSFILWLQSKTHISSRELDSDLQDVLGCIESCNAGRMARITGNAPFKQLHYYLHCEQLFLYNLLKDESILEILFNGLQSHGAFFNLLDGQHERLSFFFEVCTYNDMCLKCYESIYALQDELRERIGQLLLKKFASSSTLSRYITKCFPVLLSVRISSFRPFEYQSGCFTRNGADLSDYTTYGRAVASEEYKETNVQQFFNPWIAQHIFSYQVDDFVASVEQLGDGDFTDYWELEKKFAVLSNQIEQSVADEIAAKLISKRTVFTNPAVCRSILDFSIDLVKKIGDHNEECYSLIRHLAANAILDDEQLPKLITNLKALQPKFGEITAAINDQQMLMNTCLLIRESLPVQGRYRFESMRTIAQNIDLRGVHPTIISFIRKRIAPSNLIQRTWKKEPAGYSALVKVLVNIIDNVDH